MCEVVIRGFEPADAEPVAGMIRDLAAFHGDEAAASALDLVRYGLGPDRLSTLWVALLDGESVGFAATYDWMNYIGGFPTRNIDLFFVRRQARRRGIGRALLASIARGAKDSGCRRMTVGAVADNPSADAFYRRSGFEVRDVRANRHVVSGDALDRLTAV